jgi:predicted CoA-substrate-specific enzyme activase
MHGLTEQVRRQATIVRYDRLAAKDRDLYLGIDVGSTSSDIVLLDSAGRILYSDYKRTLGRPVQTAYNQLTELLEQIGTAEITLTAATGSAGRFLAKLLHVPFVNEVPAQACALHHLYPELTSATVIEMGGQDSKLVFLGTENGKKILKDFSLNTVCAAGTGSFLDQQAQRLGINIENEFADLALQSQNPPRIAGRCSVFAKSDMIHLQQQATPMSDILAGLCLGLARNLKSNLGCGREFVKPFIFTGGVASNAGVVRAIEQVFELSPGELIVPVEHCFTGAIGAILLAKKRHQTNGKLDIAKLNDYLSGQSQTPERTACHESLCQPALPSPQSPLYDESLKHTTAPVEAYLGVDVGSISTNVVVMDSQKRVLAKAYVMTAGKPLEAVQEGLRIVEPVVAGKVQICGAATTGSGRYLTGDFIGADTVINEITAQAAGAAIVNPSVDTIFEIGGQDSKYISLENGVVVDFEMNHACAAGTGSFLEEQAQRLGISIKEEFAKLAFQSKAPLKLGERCTVFMESDMLNYQQQGAKTEDLVAGLSYAIVTNYLNRVVGRRKVGNNICFQGGTAFNKAVWAAFEMVVGKPIMVPDHHEVTGALGAAYIAAEYMKNAAEDGCAAHPVSKFKGFDSLTHLNYTVTSFICQHCPNDCEIKQVQMEGAEPLYYGSRCDRYNLKKEKKAKTAQFDAFEYRRKKLFEYGGFSRKEDYKQDGHATIGIPLALGNWQLLPLFGRFFKELGLNVICSGETTKNIIRTGVESVNAQTCFPVKVVYGHVAHLLEKQPDYIFMPSVVSMQANYPKNPHNQLCPYVQSVPYQIRTAFADKLGKTKLLTPVMRFGDGTRNLQKGFVEAAKAIGISPRRARKALQTALEAQNDFEQACRQKGREILGSLKENEKLFILISRPYNGCDAGVNLELPKKLAQLNAKVIPMDMLELDKTELTDPTFHSKLYWKYGQHIMRTAEVINRDKRLYAIYLSNFSCGPDSFLLTFFKDIMGEKPCLQLELDEHSADAGVITRLEAFFESLKHYKGGKTCGEMSRPCHVSRTFGRAARRTLYVPWMGDQSYGLAACFRAYGQPAEVLPIADETALMEGRRFTTGKECLPCAITAGDMLKVLRDEKGNRDEIAFFMPGGIGPCRFGMYNCLHQQILRDAGYGEVRIMSPNQDVNFYEEVTRVFGDVSPFSGFSKRAWVATVGIDLLRKLIIRIRPYAVDPNRAKAVYDDALAKWIKAIERRGNIFQMRRVMREIADSFSQIEMSKTNPKPTIGIVGEIYVRSHEFANQNIIDKLESLGAACDLASLAEWIYYTNVCRRNLMYRKRWFKDLLRNQVENFFQKKIEKMLATPLEAKFGPLAEKPVEQILELAAPYVHYSFEGEAILSIGKIIEYHHQGVGGVINVMPFTCMPSTIVSTQTMRLSADCGNMPILNISFDGQSDPTLTTRLEAFVEQVRQRQTLIPVLAGSKK